MEEFEKNKITNENPSAIPGPSGLVQDESPMPKTYPGSGLHKNPARMMKIEEVVEWDMEFGVKIGPVGYDHSLACPYCRKRMLLVSHEGSRHQRNIRILYRCENCSAHTMVQFYAPNQKVELPELSLGEKIIIEKPTPVPNQPQDLSTSTEKRSPDRNRKNRNQPSAPVVAVPTENPNRQERPNDRNNRNRNNKNSQPDLRKNRLPEPIPVKPPQISRQPIAKLPGEQIKKLSPTNTMPVSNPQPPVTEKKSNAYFRSRRKTNPEPNNKPGTED